MVFIEKESAYNTARLLIINIFLAAGQNVRFGMC